MENPDKKKYIFICTGSDCKKNGSKKIIKKVEDYIKKEKLRSSVRLVKTKCLDHCKKGPNAIINNHLHHNVKEQEIISLTKIDGRGDYYSGSEPKPVSEP